MFYLAKAIKSAFNADSALSSAASGGIYYHKANKDAAYPYVVFDFVTIKRVRTFTERGEDILIQFAIFTETSDFADESDIYKKLDDVFDEGSLSPEGYSSIYCLREITRPPIEDPDNKDVWILTADYRWEVEETGYGEGGYGEGGYGGGGFG